MHIHLEGLDLDTPIKTRVCSACIEAKPITSFRPRKGGRHGVCNDCHAERERERRTIRRHKRLDKFASQLRRAQNDKAVRTATALMIYLMGGVKGFVIAWQEQWEATMKNRPGGREAMNYLLALMRLWEACPPEKPDYSQCTEEELHDAIDRRFQAFLDRNYPGL